MAELIITNKAELKAALKEISVEIREEEKKATQSERLYTRNQVRKKLGKAWKTIDKLIINGIIKTTKDGLISEAAINEYLQKS